jgi:hypothetical protein
MLLPFRLQAMLCIYNMYERIPAFFWYEMGRICVEFPCINQAAKRVKRK